MSQVTTQGVGERGSECGTACESGRGGARRLGEGCAVVVLAGGRARRFGSDKLRADLGGAALIDRALTGVRAALPGAVVIAVGPAPDGPGLVPHVRWVREAPPGGGPVAALAAALAVLSPGSRVVLVVAGDAPFAGSALPRLTSALAGDLVGGRLGGARLGRDAPDGVVAVDHDGRRQPLLAAYREQALRAAVGAAPAAGRSMRDVIARLELSSLSITNREAFDVDLVEELVTAAALLDQDGGP